jgi:signal transduction histidine kinase
MIAVQKPSIGAYWSYQSGVVYGIDAGHPSAQAFRIGDQIVQIADLLATDWYRLGDKHTGESIYIQVNRNGEIQEFDVEITQLTPWATVDRLPPFLVAFGFWIIGSYVLAFSRASRPAILFFLLSQSAVLALTCGAISSYGPSWTKIGFHCGILWLGFFAVHLHLFFPVIVNWKYKQLVISSLVVATAISSIFYILQNLVNFWVVPVSFLWAVTFGIFGVDMGIVIFTTFQSYRKASTVIERHQVGAIVLSSLFGIIPVVTLILIPQIILGHPMVSFEIAFLALLAIPAGYGFAIFKYRLIGVKQTINRGMPIVFIALVISGFYSIWFSISSKFFSPIVIQSPIWGLLTTAFLAGITMRLYDILVHFVNKILYGGWYDYRSVVELARSSLTATDLNRESVGATLCQVIGHSMCLETVRLILPGGTIITSEARLPVLVENLPLPQCDVFITQAESLIGENDGFLPWDSTLDQAFPRQSIKNFSPPQFLVLLRGKENHALGVLLIGQKQDGESLNGSDFAILKVVIHQAQVTLENVRLLEEVQKHSVKISRLHRQVIRGREEERKRLARDLHDLIIQALVGVNYQIAEVRIGLNRPQEVGIVKMQSQIKQLIGDLRQICADLRPPTLDVLDFSEAIQTKVAEIEENASFRTRVFIEGNEEQEISEDVRLCIYRLIQESLINANKHAQADHVEVWVQVTSEQVTVMVTDNGTGFEVPARLEYLIPDKHYGLIGLKEMVEAVNGDLQINSKPGQGCVLAANIPL